MVIKEGESNHSYVERIDGYDVNYEYARREYMTRMLYDPGERLRVRRRDADGGLNGGARAAAGGPSASTRMSTWL